MKTVFITYDQAHHDGVVEALSSSLCRGYTLLTEVAGKGDNKVEPLLTRLKKLDADNPMLGLRAFVWNVEQSI